MEVRRYPRDGDVLRTAAMSGDPFPRKRASRNGHCSFTHPEVKWTKAWKSQIQVMVEVFDHSGSVSLTVQRKEQIYHAPVTSVFPSLSFLFFSFLSLFCGAVCMLKHKAGDQKTHTRTHALLRRTPDLLYPRLQYRDVKKKKTQAHLTRSSTTSPRAEQLHRRPPERAWIVSTMAGLCQHHKHRLTPWRRNARLCS